MLSLSPARRKRQSVACNRQLSRWRHLTTAATTQFAFVSVFKFCIPSGEKVTIDLTSVRQAKP